MTNYESAIERINKATTKEELIKLEQSFDRVYNCGFLTCQEFIRLDRKLFSKLIKLDDAK